MAYSTITDFYNGTLFDSQLALRMLEKNVLLTSGVAVLDQRVMDIITGANGARTIDLPYINQIADDEPNVSNDTTGTATPKKLTGSNTKAIGQYKNQAWSDMDLQKYYTGADPLMAVLDSIADYWNSQYENTMIYTIQGIIADNVANDSSDMVNDIANGAATTDPTSANLISAEAIIDTQLTSGDRMEDYQMIVMHSVVYAKLRENNLIDFMPDSDQKPTIPFYQGLRVLYSDKMPKAATGTNADSSTKYTYDSYLLGSGAFAFGDANPQYASEIDRTVLSGNGGGQTTLVSRRSFAVHPYGFKWEENSMASDSPTYAELAMATNWDRKFERKRIPIACLKTNG